jgi:hypothetical protein
MPEARSMIQNSIRIACYSYLTTIGEQHGAAIGVRDRLAEFVVPNDPEGQHIAADDLAMYAACIYDLAPSVTGKAHYRCGQVYRTLRDLSESIDSLAA